ncbi:hypothetical protein BT63DRAFT_461195 [Microthyrium microscopicum]|uniref:Uncharacterized protein n=1 Tax=Microthyrium microscopicum TaxID=703497 RepID=A0A6A6TTS7_9PEZI|nr:hypothetical protein BT63DRAFT_461195 [Microthyrium microscopicum]
MPAVAADVCANGQDFSGSSTCHPCISMARFVFKVMIGNRMGMIFIYIFFNRIQQNSMTMSSQIIYIPNLIGGQALQITSFEDSYSISTESLSSRGLALQPVNMQRAGSTSSSSSSGPSSYIPEDAF